MSSRERAKRWAPLALVLALAVVYRLLPLVNAAQTNADAAVVGLQAMHVLRGEQALFLWGSGYQTAVDSYVAAVAFAIAGATPRALMASSVGLHLAVIALAWSTIARRVDGTRAALCVAPLVFASSPVETYVLYPPREASIAIAVAAAWVMDRAADVPSGRARAFAIAGVVLALAPFADPYALVLVPPIAALGIACAIGRAERRGWTVAALFAGLAVGAAPFAIVRASARAQGGPLGLTLDALARNARLLVSPCLPWTVGAEALGTRAHAMTYEPWDAPLAIRAVQIAGGTLFVVAIAAGGACVFLKRVAWPVRRLAIAGGLALPVTLAGFLASPMVMDAFSARYLVAIVVLAPFALAPIAASLGTRRFAALILPCVIASGVSGCIGLGPLADPPANGTDDEARLEDALASRGITYATADYWTAYRLTFLTRERLVVVPNNPREDRYAPYRAAFDSAARVAYVFDPLRSRDDAGWVKANVDAEGAPFRVRESIEVGRFRVRVLDRAPLLGGR